MTTVPSNGTFPGTGSDPAARVKIEDPQSAEIDGVRTLWVKAPRPFTAVLMFRVGFFDETLRTRGITHLTEHLAMAPLKDTELQFNGAVEGFKTLFYAQGHPDRVGAFLTDVCRSLSNLPTERVDVEAGVLLQEAQTASSFSYAGQICAAYFGPRGPGLIQYKELGLSWLGAQELLDWSGRYFTKANAALALTGPPPDGWSLPLPQGEARPLRLQERSIAAPGSPVLLETQQSGVSWGSLIHVPRRVIEPDVMTSVNILSKRLQDRLRHDLGRVYSVSNLYWRLDEDHVYTHLGVDSDAEHSREVATEFHKVVAEYVESGPTVEELQRQVREFERQLEDYPDQASRGYLVYQAEADLCGWPRVASPPEVVEALEALEPEAVRERFAEAYRQSYLIADLEAGILDPPAELKTGTPFAGKDFARKYLTRAVGNATVIRIAPEGISARFEQGWFVWPTSEIELIMVTDAMVHIDAADKTLSIDTKRYRQGKTIEEHLREVLPADLFLPTARKATARDG